MFRVGPSNKVCAELRTAAALVDPYTGHLCYNVSATSLPEPPGFVVSDWRTNHFAREPSPISRFVQLHS